jgi:hypothetical protein
MAAVIFQVLESNVRKTRNSASSTIDFLSIKIGASALEIKETSGHFDFSAKKLVNIADGGASGEAVSYNQFTTALGLKIDATEKGAANGVATLGADGKLPSSQLPALAISDTFVVASQAAQTALTAEVGDVAVRTDENKTYILRLAGPSTFSNWQEIVTPGTGVMTVNGEAGPNVVLDSDDIGEGTTNLYYTAASSSTSASSSPCRWP